MPFSGRRERRSGFLKNFARLVSSFLVAPPDESGGANGRKAGLALEIVEVDRVAHEAPARVLERLMVPRMLRSDLERLRHEQPALLARDHLMLQPLQVPGPPDLLPEVRHEVRRARRGSEVA